MLRYPADEPVRELPERGVQQQWQFSKQLHVRFTADPATESTAGSHLVSLILHFAVLSNILIIDTHFILEI